MFILQLLIALFIFYCKNLPIKKDIVGIINERGEHLTEVFISEEESN